MHLKLEIAGAIVIIIVLVGAFFYLRPDILGIMAEKEPAPVIECNMDADCAPAGCSNQICATAEKAPTIITTCEFRDEWECLAKTSCGCVKNKCAWKDNPEYQQCMEKFKG